MALVLVDTRGSGPFNSLLNFDIVLLFDSIGFYENNQTRPN